MTSLGWILPSREGFVVAVRDPTQPRGKQAIEPSKYFHKHQKASATRLFDTLKKKYADRPQVTVTLHECLF